MHPTKTKRLTATASGATVIFRSIPGCSALTTHLAALGLFPGVKAQVFRNDTTGPLVIGFQGCRMMLGREFAEQTQVVEQEAEQ